MFFLRKLKLRREIETSFGQIKNEGFNFNLISRYFNNKDHSNEFQIVSDQVCDDLDLDLVFGYLDRTSSKIGQQYLYNRLRTINYSKSQFDKQELIIKYLEQNPQIRIDIQLHLKKLDSNQAYYLVDLFQKEMEEKARWYFVIPFISVATLLSIILSFFNSQLFLLVLIFFSINAIIHYGLKRKVKLFVNSVPSLLQLGGVAKNMLKDKVIKKSNVNIERSIDIISMIRRKMSFFKLEQKIDSDMEAAYWFLLEIIKITFLLEPLLLFSAIEKLRTRSKEIEEVFCFVGEIDAIISIMSLREGNKICVPAIDEKANSMKGENIIHPLVIDCVPNSLSRSEKSVLLTGSNMSGKTTFIRALGLNYITGITLNTCFASSIEIPIAKIFSIIRISDDIMNYSSYFLSEVTEMKNLIDSSQSQTPSIILLDELFKGTNTKERIASAKAILSYLVKSNNQVFVATHDIELTEMLKGEYDLYHFLETVESNEIVFDYKLKTGVPIKGNAIEILAINGFPDEIITEAMRLT